MVILELTRAEFADQLTELGWWYATERGRAQCLADWDRDIGANNAVLTLRGRSGFGCFMATVATTGFFATYLPICDRLAGAT